MFGLELLAATVTEWEAGTAQLGSISIRDGGVPGSAASEVTV